MNKAFDTSLCTRDVTKDALNRQRFDPELSHPPEIPESAKFELIPILDQKTRHLVARRVVYRRQQ